MNKGKINPLDFYYRIWVDGIVKFRSNPTERSFWKLSVSIYINTAIAIILIALLSIISKTYFGGKHLFGISVSLFQIRRLNLLLGFAINYILPLIIINYFLIFRNKRYEKLLLKYQHYQGRLFNWFCFLGISAPPILLIIYMLLSRKK